MKRVTAILFVLLFSTAGFAESKTVVPKNWEKFSNNFFSFYAPTTLKKQSVNGDDSVVEEYKNEQMTVTFDYGFYPNDAG
jgi:hypothetical protein